MDGEQLEWRWCLVGNIIDTRAYGQNHEMQYGTKNFSPGTKVYVNISQWGDGGDNLIVIGKPKSKKQYIECVIRCEFICNWRLQKIYSPILLKKMANSKYKWWGNDNSSKNLILYLAKARNEFKNNKYHYNTKEDLLLNLEKVSLIDEFCDCIKRNLKLNMNGILKYVKEKILDNKCAIFGKVENFIVDR